MPAIPLLLAAVLLAAAPAPAPAAPSPRHAYAEGQVWHYRTRPGEEGSVVAIRRVEAVPELGPVFHVSVTGVKIGDRFGTMLPHLPVSRETLDASVTRRAKGTFDLPPFEDGIAEWRAVRGGVFTLDLAAIVGFVQTSLAGAVLPEDEPKP
ncbi:MAG TPA: hypothetical protein VE053_12145 [Allosphingosinicella sp.]|nr:hypothetical protein [Allosphingosinicella sp.]